MNKWAMEHGKACDRLLIDLMLAHRPKCMSGSEVTYNGAGFVARQHVLADAWSAMITEGLGHPDALLRNQDAR
jgi:hypothetical protein